MRLDRKTRRERVQRGVRLHFGGIDVKFFSPHQPGGLTLLHNLLKEAAKDLHPVALTETRETGMVGQRLAQVIAQVPQNAEPISRMAHQLSFRANTLEEHDQ